MTPRAERRVAEVRALPGYRLRMRFNDGSEGEVDMAGFVWSPKAGEFAVLRHERPFAQAEAVLGAVGWPGGLDLAPDALAPRDQTKRRLDPGLTA